MTSIDAIPAEPPVFKAAPIFARLLAFAVDVIVVSAASYALVWAFPGLISISSEARQALDEARDSLPMDPDALLGMLRQLAVGAVWLGVAQTYFIVFEWACGFTPGKAAFGLRVVRAKDGGKPGFVASAVRDTVRWMWDAHLGLIFALPMMARGTGRRAGDWASGLRVVRIETTGTPL